MIENLNKYDITTVDSFFKHFGQHPITYADMDSNNDCYFEQCLTHKEDLGSRQSLDYIFEVYYRENSEDIDIKKRLKLVPDKFQIEKFLTHQNSNKYYSQLSDHFGLSCEISYEKLEEEEETNIRFDDMLNEHQLLISYFN